MPEESSRERRENIRESLARMRSEMYDTFPEENEHPERGPNYLNLSADSIPLNLPASGNSWHALNSAITFDTETTGGAMPSISAADGTTYVPLVQRLETQLDERRRELRAQVNTALAQAESIASNLREAKDLLNSTNLTTRDLDECKYLARNSREYLNSASRAVNPFPAAFTNMIRLSRNISQERTRIEAERATATLEDQQQRFQEAVAADDGYVPSPLDYVQVDRISQWPLMVVSVTPAQAHPDNLAEATVVLEVVRRSGQHYTRSLGWLRSHGMVQTTQDARPERLEAAAAADGSYMPQAGDAVEIDNDICQNGGEAVRRFNVLNVNMDTSATDADGNPNPYVRLADVSREDLTWTRRLSTLRGAGLRLSGIQVIPSPDEYVPEVGDYLQFNSSDAMTYCVTSIEYDNRHGNHLVRFYATADVPTSSRRTPFEYSYNMEELRSIDMRRVSNP